jgi:hypothetical protein
MQARLGRSERNPEGCRYLWQWQAEVVVHRDKRTRLGLESAHPAVQLVAIRDRSHLISCRWTGERSEDDIESVSVQASSFIDARVDEHPAEPRVEPVRVSHRRQVPPRQDECVLDGVFRPLGVPKDQPGRTVEARDRGSSELGEGSVIAALCTQDELSLHHGPRLGDAHLARSQGL